MGELDVPHLMPPPLRQGLAVVHLVLGHPSVADRTQTPLQHPLRLDVRLSDRSHHAGAAPRLRRTLPRPATHPAVTVPASPIPTEPPQWQHPRSHVIRVRALDLQPLPTTHSFLPARSLEQGYCANHVPRETSVLSSRDRAQEFFPGGRTMGGPDINRHAAQCPNRPGDLLPHRSHPEPLIPLLTGAVAILVGSTASAHPGGEYCMDPWTQRLLCVTH